MASSLFDPTSPRCLIWTLDSEPALPPRFSLPNHVISGPPEPAILFPTGPWFSFANHVTSGSLSPRSFFLPVRGLPLHFRGHDVTSGSGHVTSSSGDVTSGHVTSGCLSPRSPWPAVSVAMTTSRPIRSHPLSTNQKPSIWAVWAPLTTLMVISMKDQIQFLYFF